MYSCIYLYISLHEYLHLDIWLFLFSGFKKHFNSWPQHQRPTPSSTMEKHHAWLHSKHREQAAIQAGAPPLDEVVSGFEDFSVFVNHLCAASRKPTFQSNGSFITYCQSPLRPISLRASCCTSSTGRWRQWGSNTSRRRGPCCWWGIIPTRSSIPCSSSGPARGWCISPRRTCCFAAG